MITKLDRLVARYLFELDSERPYGELEIAAWMDRVDRARFRLLDALIRKPRYRGLACRVAWKAKGNPHRPPCMEARCGSPKRSRIPTRREGGA